MKTKILLRENLKDYITINYGEQPIEIFEKMVKDFKKLGATHIDIYCNRDYDDGSIEDIELTPFKITFETEEQKNERLKLEVEKQTQEQAKKNVAKEIYERELLAALKEKYETKIFQEYKPIISKEEGSSI